MPPWEKHDSTNNTTTGSPWIKHADSPADITGVNTQKDGGSLLQMLAPSAYKRYQDMKSSAYEMSGPNTPIKDNALLLMDTAFDVSDIPKRTAAFLTGQGEMSDPEANMFNSARQRMRDAIDKGISTQEEHSLKQAEKYKDGHWTDVLPDNDPDKYLLDPRSPGAAVGQLKVLRKMGDMFFEFAGDPFLVKSIIKNSFKKMASIPKTKGRAGLEVEGYEITPAQAGAGESGMGQKWREIKEGFAQANPFTEGIPGKIREENIDLLKSRVSGESKKMGGKQFDELGLGESRGAAIAKRAEKLKDVEGKLYAKGEDVISSEFLGKPVPGEVIATTTKKPSGLVGPTGEPLMKDVTKETFVSSASKKIDNMLKDVGYTGGKITETKQISGDAIGQALKYKKQIGEADTVEELINTKRSIADKIFADKKAGLFTGTRDQTFLKGINKELNDVVEESIVKALPKGESEQFVRAYKNINKQYSDMFKLMEEPAKKLNIGKASFNSDKVIDQIKNMAPDQIQKMRNSLDTKPNIKPFFKELQKGAFEAILNKSILSGSTKGTRQLSPDKLITEWGRLGEDTKKALFDKQMIKTIDDNLDAYKMTQRGDFNKLNPSGTAKGNFLISIAKNPVSFAQALASYVVIKHHYKAGKGFHESALNLIPSIGKMGEKTIDNKLVNGVSKAALFSDFFKPELREE